MTSDVVTSERIFYWRRTVEVVCIVGALVVLGLHAKDVPPVVIATVIGLLPAALALGPSPTSNVSTTIKKTIPPPPMPAPWAETYAKPSEPPPVTKDVKS